MVWHDSKSRWPCRSLCHIIIYTAFSAARWPNSWRLCWWCFPKQLIINRLYLIDSNRNFRDFTMQITALGWKKQQKNNKVFRKHNDCNSDCNSAPVLDLHQVEVHREHPPLPAGHPASTAFGRSTVCHSWPPRRRAQRPGPIRTKAWNGWWFLNQSPKITYRNLYLSI